VEGVLAALKAHVIRLIMAKDLTTSAVDRQNILNNHYAVSEIEKAAGIESIPFEGRRVVLKDQVAEFFGVTARTIDGYIAQHGAELSRNGYEVLAGKRLKIFKESYAQATVGEINFVDLKSTPQLGVCDGPYAEVYEWSE